MADKAIPDISLGGAEQNMSRAELAAVAKAVAALPQEDRNLLAAVQESPYRLTTLEQFREFPANTEYFILESNISKVEDVGWRYLAQHLDVLLPPELLDAIDPAPFGKHAMQEEQGCFTSRGYLWSVKLTALKIRWWSREAPPCHIAVIGLRHPLREPYVPLSEYTALLLLIQTKLTFCG